MTLLLFNSLNWGFLQAQGLQKQFNLSAYNPRADGISDDTRAFVKMFTDVSNSKGGTVTIPAGEYYLEGNVPVPISSNTTVFAYGATFNFPTHLGDRALAVMFEGEDVSDFSWFGGTFKGFCFDPGVKNNTWEPNSNSRAIVIHTSENGKTGNLSFRDIQSSRVAGSVINVNGYVKGITSDSVNFATNVSIENCTLIQSGKFMWDYGFLWQIIVFKEYGQDTLAMAYKYFDTTLIHKNMRMVDGDSRIALDNTKSSSGPDTRISVGQDICFYNDKLPVNIVLGKRYYVVGATSKYIQVSDSIGGRPIQFRGAGGPNVHIINEVRKAFFQYAPIGQGPGKGCIDLVGCKNTTISGCRISALGDAMHVQRSHNNVFANNHIMGARMGAFFLAEYCKNSTITGNTVDGTNGSRTVSIERSNEDVTVTGNIFKNGGRGSWINQPRNIIMQGNLFINNTTKAEKNSATGRRDFKTGGWQSFPEIYFTTYQKGAKYGPVILRDNIFVTSPDAAAAVQFEKNGVDVHVDGNVFKGSTGVIMMDEEDTSITIGNNQGAVIKKGREYSGSLFKNE